MTSVAPISAPLPGPHLKDYRFSHCRHPRLLYVRPQRKCPSARLPSYLPHTCGPHLEGDSSRCSRCCNLHMRSMEGGGDEKMREIKGEAGRGPCEEAEKGRVIFGEDVVKADAKVFGEDVMSGGGRGGGGHGIMPSTPGLMAAHAGAI